jgi:protoheme IX farnesyltransferase
MGIYLLVVVGATAAMADVTSACGSWPLCQQAPSLAEPVLLVAWLHRVVALAVGALTLWTVGVAFASETVARRVKAALAGSVALYGVQVGIGAVVATNGASAPFPMVHLVAGMGIFGGLTLALAWHLEPRTGADASEHTPVSTGDTPDGTAGTDTPDVPGAAAEATAETDTAADADATTASADHAESGGSPTLGQRAFAYFRLMKPRLMWLLCLVASAGMALAATTGAPLTVATVAFTLSGGVLAIGASGTFNHVFERDVDKEMDRTSDRPVATHEIPVRNAVAFGLALAVASVTVFFQLNPLAVVLGVTAILFYSIVYTLLLKPNTVQNTVIGGAAGALPALIGWAAVTGGIGLPGLALAGIVFVWTPAHFYNLALAYKDDYEAGGFPMMPVVRGEATTRKHILLWLAATLLTATALAALTNLGWLYAATTTALGAVFLWTVIRLHRERTEGAAFRAFHASNAYLGALLLAIVVDALAI